MQRPRSVEAEPLGAFLDHQSFTSVTRLGACAAVQVDVERELCCLLD